HTTFYLLCARYHRDLPSFPTRRSTDLDDLHALVLERLGQRADAQPAGRVGPPVLIDDDYRETELHRGSCLLLAQSAQLITIARLLRPIAISHAAARRRWPGRVPPRAPSPPAARGAG